MAKKDCEKCKTCIHSGLCSKETNRKVYTGKLKMSPCELYISTTSVILAPMPMADWLKQELTEYVHERCMEEL